MKHPPTETCEPQTLEEIEATIALLEMEVGTLSGVRRSPNPLHSIAGGKLEIKRRKEIEQLRSRLIAA